MTVIYANRANENKAQQLAFDAYNHLKDYLAENYDTLTDKELDNMIHNVEQIIPIVENPSVELLRPLL
jgi:hypothetical protein